MKFQIKHECRGRIRVQAVQQRMTLEQADMLEAWLLTLPQVECASVHERTRCAVIEYQGDRKDLLRILAGFSYQDHALAELVPVHSSRALNRAYGKNWWVWWRLRPSDPCSSRLRFVRSTQLFGRLLICSGRFGVCCGDSSMWSCWMESPSACPWYGGTSTRPVP